MRAPQYSGFPVRWTANRPWWSWPRDERSSVMVGRHRSIAPDDGVRLSRRKAMQLSLGAAAAFGLVGMPVAPARVGAQETGAADVTGPFDWKRHDGTTIRALLNEHPYTTALEADLQTFTD